MYAFSASMTGDFAAIRNQVAALQAGLEMLGPVNVAVVCGSRPDSGSFIQSWASHWPNPQAVNDAPSVLSSNDQFTPPPQPPTWITVEQNPQYVKGAYWLGYNDRSSQNALSLYGYASGAGPSMPLAAQYVFCGVSAPFQAPGNASLNGKSLDIWVPRSCLSSPMGRRIINSLLEGHDQRNPPQAPQDALVVGVGDAPNVSDAATRWHAFTSSLPGSGISLAGSPGFVVGA